MTDQQTNIIDIIFGRWRSQVVYAGINLGVFDALDRGGSLDTLLFARFLWILPTLSTFGGFGATAWIWLSSPFVLVKVFLISAMLLWYVR